MILVSYRDTCFQLSWIPHWPHLKNKCPWKGTYVRLYLFKQSDSRPIGYVINWIGNLQLYNLASMFQKYFFSKVTFIIIISFKWVCLCPYLFGYEPTGFGLFWQILIVLFQTFLLLPCGFWRNVREMFAIRSIMYLNNLMTFFMTFGPEFSHILCVLLLL